jgi:hypothetical protein
VTEDCGAAMVVGSADPFSLRVGGSLEVIVKKVSTRELKVEPSELRREAWGIHGPYPACSRSSIDA